MLTELSIPGRAISSILIFIHGSFSMGWLTGGTLATTFQSEMDSDCIYTVGSFPPPAHLKAKGNTLPNKKLRNGVYLH